MQSEGLRRYAIVEIWSDAIEDSVPSLMANDIVRKTGKHRLEWIAFGVEVEEL